MNVKLMLAAISLFITGILTVAVSSIAIECFNKNEGFKNEKKINFNFTVTVLVSSILMVIAAGGSMYLAAQMPNF